MKGRGLLTDLLRVLVCEVKGVARKLYATVASAAALDGEGAVVFCGLFVVSPETGVVRGNVRVHNQSRSWDMLLCAVAAIVR